MNSWPRVRLGEVLRREDCSIPASDLREVSLAGVYSFGKGLFKRGPMSPADTSYKYYNRLVAGDFVISTPKAWEGALALVSPEFDGWYLSPVFPTFRVVSARLLPAFLEWYCRRASVWAELQQMSRGIGARRESVHPSQFLSLEIPLPPLAEQRRVVARIEELAAQIEEARRLRREAVEEGEGLCFQCLESLLRPDQPDWTTASLGKIVVSMDAGWSPQCHEAAASDGEWGVLKTTAVQWWEFRAEHNKALPNSLVPRPELAVQLDDVLVTRAGPRKRVGVVATVRCGQKHLTISDKLIRLRVDKTKVLPRFLELALAAPSAQEHLGKRKTGLAEAQVNISQSILRATPISFPALSEQYRIIAEFDELQSQVDSLKRLQAETEGELEALLPAILDRAFRGEL